MCKLKIILLLVLFVLLSAVLCQAESVYTFSSKNVQAMKKTLQTEMLLLNELEMILLQQGQQLKKLQKSEQDLKSQIAKQLLSLSNLENINQDLDQKFKAEKAKNKILQITLGTTIPITFIISIGVGVAIGYLVWYYIKK